MSKDLTKISMRRRPGKFTASAKITLTAFSVMGFVGGWNLIGRLEKQSTPAIEPTLNPVSFPTPATTANRATPTPWPAIPPLPEIPPIPTLDLASANLNQLSGNTPLTNSNPDTIHIAPIPTLAPLPTPAPLPTIPAPPPPPPPVIMPAGGNHSGGS